MILIIATKIILIIRLMAKKMTKEKIYDNNKWYQQLKKQQNVNDNNNDTNYDKNNTQK